MSLRENLNCNASSRNFFEKNYDYPATKSWLLQFWCPAPFLCTWRSFWCPEASCISCSCTVLNWDDKVTAPCDESPWVAWRALGILVVFTNAFKWESTCFMKTGLAFLFWIELLLQFWLFFLCFSSVVSFTNQLESFVDLSAFFATFVTICLF